MTGAAGDRIDAHDDDRPYVHLASQSPRRRDLLDQARIPYRVLVADPDEDVEALEVRHGDESPRRYVRRVTRLKLDAALRRVARRGGCGTPVLVGDTTVAIGRAILGKPADAADARRMLGLLSGRSHRVLTAVAVGCGTRIEDALSVSTVRFRPLTAAEIDAYVGCGEPFGKAGSYAIQGRAGAFVERIAGSYSGIVGLPLVETSRLLARFGIDGR